MGSTIKTIGLAYFRKLEIAVPTRREQDAVATRMLDFDGLLWKSKGELNKLRFLQHGVMDDLLTGRARAKVDREVAE
jgi:type I restriction enzyme S subunit